MNQDQRSILNEIFLPLTDTSWELIPRSVLLAWELHPNTLLFFSEKHDSLALLLWRKEPSDESFVGNFPCSINILDWMQDRLRLPTERKEEGVKWAFVITIENAKSDQLISFAQVQEVLDRTKHLDPFVAKKSGDKFVWLDQDLFPAKIYSHRRAFREIRHIPKFMRHFEKNAAD